MNENIEKFYDKEFPDSKKRSKQEVIDFVEKYNSRKNKADRLSECLSGRWSKKMVRKHEFDIKYNIKRINWEPVIVILVLLQLLAPLILGLIYNDIFGYFKAFSILMCFIFYPSLFLFIIYGPKEPYQTEEDYIENGTKNE